MKLNKNLIDLLKTGRQKRVNELLSRQELNLIVCDNGICSKNLKSLSELDEIFYTLDFLEREHLVTVETGGNDKIYHVGDCLVINSKDLNEEKIDHLIFTQELLEKHYNKIITIQSSFYDFTDHWFCFFRYKTEKQREKLLQIWVPVSVAIISSFLTFF
ncbi:MAG: hypothetical protein NUV47_03485 [Patescibacteria group bacterium]|nr:hypothetical protein [Patescibacteria group bacterium]